MKTSVPVPVPLMVAVILACVALVLFAIRPGQTPAAQPPVIVHVPVEVPVVREKIVTRVVYRNTRPSAQSSKQPINAAPIVDDTFAKSRATFAGFKPTEEVKLTVIKGGSGNEK